MKKEATTKTEKMKTKKSKVTLKTLQSWRKQTERIIESNLTDEKDKEALKAITAKIVGKFIDENL